MSQMPLPTVRFADVLPAQPTVSAEWGVFSLHVIDDFRERYFEGTFADHFVALQGSGSYRVRKEVDGRTACGWVSPGCVGITLAGLRTTWELDYGRPSESRRTTYVHISPAFLSRVIAQDWEVDPRKVELVGQFLIRDPVVESVVTSLAFEATNHSPSGSLYAESACEFLAHHLVRRYSSLAPKPRARGGLSGYQLRRVVEYIHENLAQSIALRDLAQLANVSPRHFERAFREAIGVAPHAYVLQQRVAAARDLLLRERTRSIDEVAQRTGFSNRGHLAAAFRHHTGYSPAAFRRMHS